MKKLIICLAIASVAVSCKKIQAGGNKNTLKLEEGAERYSDDVQKGGETHGHDATAEHKEAAVAEKHGTEAPKTDSTAAAKPVEAEKAKAEH
ncbi:MULTISPECIES: hypothetical protein [Chryseobacterium]|uniref:hypothetical protein n=1 Tax=Chryseobacterium TaxID=59732 RepID=UPI0015540E8E|nr:MULTISPECIES: hypothetical protein [unclassified Chryseobacterium]MDC8104193.1 hypothetical protein [Chryseobacterium sp. B21-037]MDQ1803802.1 hypothetical protein [Chryseobacterium sp. CKR4-1]WBV57726.1 hypothetical protein PFY10_04610 [Chryseobacterium daecheongense]